jgi:hypothetical protein
VHIYLTHPSDCGSAHPVLPAAWLAVTGAALLIDVIVTGILAWCCGDYSRRTLLRLFLFKNTVFALFGVCWTIVGIVEGSTLHDECSPSSLRIIFITFIVLYTIMLLPTLCQIGQNCMALENLAEDDAFNVPIMALYQAGANAV